MNKEERECFNLYLEMYPEERIGVQEILDRSKAIQADRDARAKERILKVEYYRRKINEKCALNIGSR